MKNMTTAVLLFVLGTGACRTFGQGCVGYTYNLGPYIYGSSGFAGHSTGAHVFSAVQGGRCEYTGGDGPCNVLASAYTEAGAGDTGGLSNPLYSHQSSVAQAQGLAFGVSGGTKADTEGVGGVAQCLVTGCQFKFSISGSGEGGGFTISTEGATPLWSDKIPFLNTCLAKEWVAPTCDDGNPNPGVGVTALPKCSSSPIIIDTTGQGFKMSDPNLQYVTFDLRGNGKYQQVSWPLPNSGNAWLVNISTSSVITSGLQLFGNYTEQPAAALPGDKNGFRALAVYDQVAKGGNYDLVIDSKDAIWSHLRLWLDTHCQANRNTPCKSLPGELYTLESKGIHSIGLVYQGSNRKDAWGNAFKYTTVLNPTTDDRQTSMDKRGIYDVWLVGKKQ